MQHDVDRMEARLREWALGGVTQNLLTDATVCVLLTH